MPAAADPTHISLDLFALLSGLLGGLAFLLYGMERLSESLKQVAGDRMRRILLRLTNTRWKGMLTGAIVTALIQSSSVTTVLLVGFVAAGIMSLPQALWVILGADIGTTVTAQLIAFNITQYGLLLIAIGFSITFILRTTGLRLYGACLMGIGLVFFGMYLMSESMSPLQTHPAFREMLAALDHKVTAFIAGALFTAAIQASAATIGIVIVLASQNMITLETAISISLGANIGTCMAAGLAAIGKPAPAVRTAVGHVLFKLLGSLMVLPFITQLAWLVQAITPDSPISGETDPSLDGNIAREIANAHTLFNVGVALVFLPWTERFARVLEWLIPSRKEDLEEDFGHPRYLDRSLIKVPLLALGQVRLEAGRMGILLKKMFHEGVDSVYSLDREKIGQVRRWDDSVDRLYNEISDYVAIISRNEMPAQQSQAILKAMSVIGNMESIGDIIETNLHHLVHSSADRGIIPSPTARQRTEPMEILVQEALHDAIDAFERDDPALAERVISLQQRVDDLDAQFKLIYLDQIKTSTLEDRDAHTFEMSLIDSLKRIFYHCRRIAKRVQDSDSFGEGTQHPQHR